MKVMWIGHGGLLFISGKNKILIDPYLSDSLRLINRLFKRRMRIKRRLFLLKPDVICLTSSHPDRADFKTVKAFANKRGSYQPTILACEKAFISGRDNWGLQKANLTMFENGLEWSLGDMTIKAVGAKSDDRSAFGLIITDNEDGKKYYVASNTLYSEELIASLPTDIYAAFIPIGGAFGSMNIIDASRFAKAINAEYTVPVQFGTLDKVKADQFIVGGRILPKIYKIIDFNSPNGVELSNGGVDFFYNEKSASSRRAKNSYAEELEDINTVTIDVPIVPALLD
ncbi:MAG: MBL fold metallo-hydrolase [Clostridia bacterium]|nr:MBL fold metallo-hydrolase [Clostridia bacterium]